MATNNSEVTKVEFSFNLNTCAGFSTNRSHTLNHGGSSWKFEVYRDFPVSTEVYGFNCSPGFVSLRARLTNLNPNLRYDQMINAKIEILNLRRIALVSIIGKWPLSCDVKWTGFCSLSYLSEYQSELAPDGNYKAILSVGPLKYLTAASSDVVVLSVPRDKSPVESLKSMLDKGILTDVVIKTSTKTFPCHKVVLASSSEVFKKMFEIEMKESTDNEVKLEGVFEEATIHDLLHYLYTKQTPPNIDNTCSTLFVAADYFQLPVLKAVCEEKLCTVIRVENAADILQLAEKYSADALKKTAVKFIVSHYKDVMNTPGWNEIPDNMAKYLLSTFLVTFAEK